MDMEKSLLCVLSCVLLIVLLVREGEASPVSVETTRAPFCWGLALDGHPITSARLATVSKEVGLPLQIVVFFLQWPSAATEGKFPTESLNAIQTMGAMPCITWEPMYSENGREITISHERILGGDYDSYLTSFARAAGKWRKPLIIRFAHEMNLTRYHWGTDRESYGPRSPEIYKRMFRYVVSVFRKEGAFNVLWAFCPNADSLPDVSFDPEASWNEPGNYYPGGDVVDVVGADGYNWGTTQTREKNGWDSRWRSFDDLFHAVRARLRTLAQDKPFVIFETATVTEGGDKGLWIREAINTATEWRLEGIVWFHVQKEQDWRFHRGIDHSCVEIVRSRMHCPPKSLERRER